jgi:hypothetical protein
LEPKDGTINATRPQETPKTKAEAVLPAMRKDAPIPRVANSSDVRMIVFVEGNATRLMKL